MLWFRMVQGKLVSTILMLLLLSHPLTCQRLLSGKSQIPFKINTMAKLQQVKERILRGLNMTSAPTRRMLTSESSKVRNKRPQILDSVDKQPNVSIIFSESTGSQRLDTMNFILDSRLRSRVQDTETALLVVLLHSDTNTEGLPQTTVSTTPEESRNLLKVKVSSQQRRQNNDTDALPGNGPLPFNSPPSQSHSDSTRDRQTKQRAKKEHRRLRGLRQLKVKIILKVIEQGSNKRRRLAQERVHVDSSTTVAIPIPKELLVKAADSPNHSLVLQLLCQRCQGRVQIETVYKNARRKNKKTSRHLNPNRPYLFIKTRSKLQVQT